MSQGYYFSRLYATEGEGTDARSLATLLLQLAEPLPGSAVETAFAFARKHFALCDHACLVLSRPVPAEDLDLPEAFVSMLLPDADVPGVRLWSLPCPLLAVGGGAVTGIPELPEVPDINRDHWEKK